MENSCQTQTGTTCTTYATNGPTIATATYGPAGELTALTYDGFTETRTYNSLLQLTRMTATSGGQTVMDMQYTYSRSQNNGRIMQSTDGTIAGGETVVYTYDTLNRLAKAETTSAAWGDAYTYDGFGNLTAKTPTKGTAPSMTASYDLANHQVGQTYDANGNTGFSGTFPYDVENHLLQPLTSGTGLQWTYDPSGKRVFAKTPGNGTTVATTCEIYFYAAGQKLMTYSCGYHDGTGGNGQFWYQVKSRNVYFGGKLMRSAGVTVVTDRLGSVRANSNGERMSYFPYGEERTSTADGREKFGTYFRDPAANGGLDYADQRYYANAGGRFLTADPSRSSSNALEPQSWNRYAYALGDPINRNDPSGLDANCGWVWTGEIWTYIDCGSGQGPNNTDMQVVNQNPDDNTQKGGGGGGGGIPWNGRGVLRAGNYNLTYVNVSTAGQEYDDLKRGLDLLTVNINDNCLHWLTTNLSGSTFSDYVSNLKIGTFDSVITTGTHMYVQAQASAGDAGFDILFASTTDGGMSGFEVYIHELAHLLNAPNFQNADGETNADGSLTTAAQKRQSDNASLIEQNCGSTVHK